MKKALLAGVAAVMLAGSTAAVYAEPWSHRHRAPISAEDRAAYADARIAAVKAGLKLTPDQEKLWPPVEQAVRDLMKQRIDRANARMQARSDAERDGKDGKIVDQVARLRERADAMAATASAMKRVADAAEPLYKTLDDGQKRRLATLTRTEGRHMFRDHWHHRAGSTAMTIAARAATSRATALAGCNGCGSVALAAPRL